MGVQTPVLDITKLLAQNEALRAENAQLRASVEQLTEQVKHLAKNLYGRKSERLQPGQLDLFRVGEAVKDCTDFGAEEVVTVRRKKKTGGHGRGSLPAHLQRFEEWLDLAEDQRFCSKCGKLCQRIGEEITERAHFQPPTFSVHRYVRPTYGCPCGCEIKTADLPDGVIAGSKFDASVHAHVVVAKFLDHLPLNRLQGIFGRHGIKLPRQTMWDMLVRVDELVAQPVLAQMKKELLEETHLHADESPVRVKAEGEKGSKQGWVWAWRNEPGIRAEKPPPGKPPRRSKVLIEFHAGRGKAIPERFLGDWSNTCICDGHPDYSAVCEANGITRAGCWAHARRPFRDQLEQSPKWAALPLFLIGRLFALERAVRNRAERLDLNQDEALELLQAVRTRSSARLVDRIVALADELALQPEILPKSKLGKGVRYILNQRECLRAFLFDPRIPIHNNDSERDLRHIVTGRKAWMIFGSQRGGEVACRLYSLVLSCKQNDVNPEEYVEDVLMAVATTPSSQIASLTPWGWAEAREAEAAAAAEE